MKKLLLFLISTLILTSCAFEEEIHPVHEVDSYINGGYTETGEPGVVYLEHQYGYACTGTLIAPTVVLTAKHCVRDLDYGQDLPAWGFSVNIGPNRYSITNSYDVDAIYKLPGNEIENEDVALMVLGTPIPETVATPYSLKLTWGGDNPVVANQTELTLIGYGESVCGQTGNSGVKLRTEDLYIGSYTTGDFVTQGRGANHGDSGGPIFTPEMKVIGVTSRGSDECSGELAGITIGASVIYHLDFINGILEDEGYCAPTHEKEICGDGSDNDCNGLVDDACLNDGDTCTDDFQCKNGICYEQFGQKTCLKSCDPRSETNSCGAGNYCRLTDCDRAICSPGSPGTGEINDLCSVDTDCETLFCRAGLDGKSRCMIPCEAGSDQCMNGELCIDVQYGCGGCVDEEYGPSAGRNTGEECNSNSDCSSGICFTVGDFGYCTDLCVSDDSCIAGYHCDGVRCIRGERGAAGDLCLVDGDCDAGLSCVDVGSGVKHCASDCSDGNPCPLAGFECYSVSQGQWCLTFLGTFGDVCGSGRNCQADYICQDIGGGDYRCIDFCSRFTADECPAYSACLSLGSYNYCVPLDGASPDSDKDKDSSFFGCSVGSGSGSEKWHFSFITVIFFGLFLLRRRKL